MFREVNTMRDTLGRRLIGLALIAVGVGYIGDLLGYWYFSIFFPGWWTLFIILPCLWSITQEGFHVGNVTFLIFGSYLLASANDWINVRLSFAYIVPIFLVIFGLKLLLSRSHAAKIEKKKKSYVNEDGYADIRQEAYFSAHTFVESGKINSVHIESVFASITLDLVDCDLHNLMFMTLETVIGNIEVRISDDVTPIISSDNVIGFCKCDGKIGSYEIPVDVSSVLGYVRIVQVPVRSFKEGEFKEK